MTALLRLSSPLSRPQALALMAILAVGTAARVYVMSHFEPASGDGPLRAAMADWWVRGLWPLDTTFAQHGDFWLYARLPIAGPWPPGHFVLAGLFILIFHDPVLSTRLLSLLLGIASIFLLYHIAAKIFGTTAGLLSAATLSLLPLHVTLSTNPLSDVPAVFFLLAIFAVVLRGLEAGFPTSLLLLLAVLTFVGTMIRYELWLTLPAISATYWYRQRSVWRTCLISILVSLAPLLWIFSTWIHYGNPFVSFRDVLSDVYPVGVLAGLSITTEKLDLVAGYFIVMASALGSALILADLRSEPGRAAKAIYLIVVFLQLIFLVWFTSQRGGNQADRYALIAVVLMIPLAAHALSGDGSPVSNGLIGAAMIGSVLFAVHLHHHHLYIRHGVPADVSAATAWLSGRLTPGETFVSTRLNGDAHTIDLLTRNTPYNVAYSHFSAEELTATWDSVRPSYVVVLSGEKPGDRLLQEFASEIDLSDPAAKFGEISIYRVKHNYGSR
jgi:hypothetical protein